MSNGHPVLGQGSSFVRADGRSGAEGFDSLQVLDKAILLGHALGRQRQADGNGGEEAFGHISHDDTDQEDDGVQPVVAESEGDDEEGHAKEDGHSRNDVDEMLNLAGDWRLSRVQTSGQPGNATHHRVVAGFDNDGFRRTCLHNNIHFYIGGSRSHEMFFSFFHLRRRWWRRKPSSLSPEDFRE